MRRANAGSRLVAAACLALAWVAASAGCEDAGLRSGLYPAPPPRPIEPLGHGRSVEFDVGRGARGHALHHAAGESSPTLVFFHGNGDQVAHLSGLGATLERRGLGFYAVEYPGYGPASDQPVSEAAIYATAEAALAHLHDALGVSPGDTVLVGQSLGTGVAVEMASRGHGARLVLISPFTSIPELVDRLLARPAGSLVADRFDTRSKAPRIALPVLIAHGARDELIPISMARELAATFPDSRLHVLDGAGHNDVWQVGGAPWLRRMEAFARGAGEAG